ncbi:MAG TPA: isochorismatase family protein [Rhizomicrobium sp.]|nr:isochorismatase family protein [Rhizomicrobium sp.]
MAIEFQRDHFENSATLPLLVIVDPRASHLASGSGLDRATGAGIVSRCRAALGFARSFGLAVSIVRGETGPWIKGLEPLRHDILIERRGRSCYANEFFDEVAQAAGGEIALAGFVGDGGCLATVADALCAGHRVTILQDATCDGVSSLFSEAHLAALRRFTRLDVRTATAGAWIASTSGALIRGSQCR